MKHGTLSMCYTCKYEDILNMECPLGSRVSMSDVELDDKDNITECKGYEFK